MIDVLRTYITEFHALIVGSGNLRNLGNTYNLPEFGSPGLQDVTVSYFIEEHLPINYSYFCHIILSY